MAACTPGALAQATQYGEWIDAHVVVGPRDAQGGGLLLDVSRPSHRFRDGHLVGRGSGRVTRRIVESQPREGIDARVVVGPGHAEGVAPHEMHVLRLVWLGCPRMGRLILIAMMSRCRRQAPSRQEI